MDEGQGQPAPDPNDESKRNLIVDLALEFAVRLNDPGFVQACNQEMAGREIVFVDSLPRAALHIVCHTLLMEFCIERSRPNSIDVLCKTIDWILALEFQYGGFDQFQEALDRVCVQLFLVLFRQWPGQYDAIEAKVQEMVTHERAVDVVFQSMRTPLQYVKEAADPQLAFAELEQRCPYNSAVQFVHTWLKTTVMKLQEPSRLERLYGALVGDLSRREDTDLETFRPIPDPKAIADPAPSLPNMTLTLGAIRGAFAGSDKQFRTIWKQIHPKVQRFLKDKRSSGLDQGPV